MHAAMQWATEQEISMEVKNAVNINSFMDELLKIELNVEQEMVFLL